MTLMTTSGMRDATRRSKINVQTLRLEKRTRDTFIMSVTVLLMRWREWLTRLMARNMRIERITERKRCQLMDLVWIRSLTLTTSRVVM